MNEAHVVGSGPNGLAAALVLQRTGLQVTLHERMSECGGGLRSEALTLPGYVHDACSAVHPLAVASPFFRSLPLSVEWIQPEHALAHPLDDGTAVLLRRSVAETTGMLDGTDAATYERLLAPLLRHWPALADDVLAPLHVPRAPLAYARFARTAAFSAESLAQRFRGERARALIAGLAAHGTIPLDRMPTAAFALVLALAAHGGGWPIVRGGSQRIAEALLALFDQAGGTVRTGVEIDSLDAFDAAPLMLDTSPAAVDSLAAGRLRGRARRALQRFRHGAGVHKVEWALREPIPWRAKECEGAGTVHLGGSFDEIARALSEAARGIVPQRPFVLLGQPTQFDRSRAPADGHIAWGYCTVPSGCDVDCTPLIEAQVERFAPGFRDCIAARHVRTAAELERYNPNLVGGSIGGGVQSLAQFFLGPIPGRSPYRVRRGRVYLCSAVTPPGPGVHGMCGYHAAHTLLRDLRG